MTYICTCVAMSAFFHQQIIGVGGVGGWAAEALCRSGVGKLTLADLDEVCISNTNRQARINFVDSVFSSAFSFYFFIF